MEKRGYGWSVTLPVLLVLLAGLQTSTAQSCPPECTCTGTVAVTVTCNNRGLTSFPQLPPDVQRTVTTLELRNNSSTVLHPNTLENYTSLQTLRLRNNQLTALPEGLLSATTQLTNLSLDINRLTALPDDLLTATTQLQELYLNNNQLTALPEGLLNATTQLEQLYLHNNQLTELPDGLLSATTQLLRLYLYNNQLTALPEGLLNATTQLEQLYLHLNQLTELPDGLLSATTQLLRLYLYNNQLTALPEGLLNATTQLEQLWLQYNQLTELPDGLLSATTQLLHLYLYNNQLTALPEGLLNATTQLEQLYLPDNQLTELPDGLLSATTQLQRLWLSNNHLTALPEGLLNATTQLEQLFLGYNQLTGLPEGLLNTTTQLVRLALSNNQLTVLSEGLLTATTQLQCLFLDNNQLTALPEGLLNTTTQLQLLYLYNNQLTGLPEGLLNTTTQLVRLFLDNNQLTELPEGLLNTTTQLRYLYLHNNRLTELPEGLLSATTQLFSLWLQNNNLTEVPERLLNGTQLLELFLSGNPFNCDCELSWLPAFLRNVPLTGNTPVTCATPENLTGRDIRTLLESLFTCMTSATSPVSSPTTSPTHQSPVSSPTTSPTRPSPVSSTSLWPVLFAPLAVILLVLLGGIVYCKRRRRTSNLKPEASKELPGDTKTEEVYEVKMSGTSAFNKLTSHQPSVQMTRMLPRRMIIPSSILKLHNSIGQGEFGVVYRANLQWQLDAATEVVAVKTLKGLFTQNDVDSLVQEVHKMHTLHHPNVMSLTGVCLDGGGGPAVVMPFMGNGSVLNYLKKERGKLVPPNDADCSVISNAQTQLLGMCLQISKGMEYLANEKIVHRDLAARNCMMDSSGLIKVADFGLSEDIYTSTYYRQEKSDTAVKLPVRWMSPESIADGIFTEMSDVWSFGVTCWEVFTGGQIPYSGISPVALLHLLRDGERLYKPMNPACSDEIYAIILDCWKEEPKGRPDFSKLVDTISVTLEAAAGYMDFSLSIKNERPVAAEVEA